MAGQLFPGLAEPAFAVGSFPTPTEAASVMLIGQAALLDLRLSHQPCPEQMETDLLGISS